MCHYQIYSKQFNIIHIELLLLKKSCTRPDMPNAKGRVCRLSLSTSLSLSLCPNQCDLDLKTREGMTAPMGSIQNESATLSVHMGSLDIAVGLLSP